MTEGSNLIIEFNHIFMHINTIVYIYNYIQTHNLHKTIKSLNQLGLINPYFHPRLFNLCFGIIADIAMYPYRDYQYGVM